MSAWRSWARAAPLCFDLGGLYGTCVKFFGCIYFMAGGEGMCRRGSRSVAQRLWRAGRKSWTCDAEAKTPSILVCALRGAGLSQTRNGEDNRFGFFPL